MEKPQLIQEKFIQKKTNMISVSAFLFSIFICIFLFYFSPSTLSHNNTKFWFLISNAIVFIIAADFGAFSSSKQKHYDLYEEFMINSKARNASSFVPTDASALSSSKPNYRLYEEFIENSRPMTTSSFLVELPENGVKGSTENTKEIRQESQPLPESKQAEVYKAETKEIQEKTISVVDNENKRSLSSSKTEKGEPTAEEDEFAAMSDEELNKRVEEFIQRFNRQIRLQETGNLRAELEI